MHNKGFMQIPYFEHFRFSTCESAQNFGLYQHGGTVFDTLLRNSLFARYVKILVRFVVLLSWTGTL